MSRYNPPHGMLDFLLSGPKTARKYTRENDFIVTRGMPNEPGATIDAE